MAAGNKRPTQGVIEVLQEEIETHKVEFFCLNSYDTLSQQVYLEEIEQHRPVIEIIVATEPFVLEHTRKSKHDDITAQVKDIKDRFENLDESEMVSSCNDYRIDIFLRFMLEILRSQFLCGKSSIIKRSPSFNGSMKQKLYITLINCDLAMPQLLNRILEMLRFVLL